MAQKKTKSAKAPASPPLPFSEAVRRAVRAIPRGQVRTYAQVALYSGKPGAARAVGREMRMLPPELAKKDVPWWRVVRADGTLASPVGDRQASLLRAEGLQVAARDGGYRVKVPPQALD
ncbi:hypothetical protein DRW03_33470 [Corallococcus sp. H22C18031201]|nr:hypothetical protein DRW03_33470 [Corallococcus sp. H22C18031201]